MSTNFDEFKRSLDALVNQAQHTAQLGLDVAKEQVETLVRNPNLGEQMEDVRRNLQTMAREMETRAQELVHLASTYVQNRPTTGDAAPSTPAPEAPANGESATAAGAGTPQEGSNMGGTDQTPAGGAPKQ